MALAITSKSGPEIPFEEGRFLAGLALGAMSYLGAETMLLDENNNWRSGYRMARCGCFALLEKPADDTSPRCIDCYLTEVEKFAPPPDSHGQGVKFKLDPESVLFSLERLHNGKPPDFHLRALSDPRIWFGAIVSMLLGELRQRCPHLFEGLSQPQFTEEIFSTARG